MSIEYPFSSKNKYQLKETSNEDKKCIIKFAMCDEKKYPLQNLHSKELKHLMKYLKKVEDMEWKNIRKDTGLNYEPLPQLSPPHYISKDITLSSMRASDKFRIIGYKENEMFFIIWFDKNHETC